MILTRAVWHMICCSPAGEKVKTITEQVLDAQRGTTELDAVVKAISELVYRYPAGRPGFSEEDGAEFLLRFYPRIRGLIRRYKPSGTTFDSYLHTTLRFQLRSFALERSTDRIRLETACDRSIAYEITGRGPADPPTDPPADLPAQRPAADTRRLETASRDAPPRSSPSRAPRRIRSTTGASPDPAHPMPAHRPSALRLRPKGAAADRLTSGEAQRLLCLILKTGERFDDTLRRRLAPVLGCDRQWLDDRWHELRDRTQEIRRRQERFRVKRDRAWFRIRCIEAHLRNAGPEERPLILAERARWSQRYRRARAELDRTTSGPTHGQIAEVLGIARGTVDSSIFKARGELMNDRYRERLARLLDAT